MAQPSILWRMVVAMLLMALWAHPAAAQPAITLHGAVQHGDDHPFTRTLQKFETLVRQAWGKPIGFNLHRNGELGLEKDYLASLNQGVSVDYAIVSPSQIASFAPSAALLDVPLLFRDAEQWKKAMESDALWPIAEELEAKADVLVIGYAGGGVRNIVARQPVRTMAELKSLSMRVMAAPIQSTMFQALGASTTVIAYNKVYAAIQSGVIGGAENEAAGIETMKFYEVGPEVSLTRHAITVRPICFSAKTFRRLPKELQDIVLKAGREAGKFGRELEAASDAERLARLKKEGKIHIHAFAERDQLLAAAGPIKASYAQELGAEAVLARIDAIK